ncbi:MAG: L,D-transpeptidase [Myxococcales bacterium]|nr:L,D-transpeptidase [Myxococcales bacterium]
MLLAAAMLLACGDGKGKVGLAGSDTHASGTPAGTTSAATAGSAASLDEAPLPVPAEPLVDLAGVVHSPPAIPEGVPRMGVIGWNAPVYVRADRESRMLGALRGGAVVLSRDAATGPTRECKAGWQGVVPSGFVCKDALTADLAHPILRAASRGPDFTRALPYMYGTVTRGGPVYARIPTEADLRAHEPSLDAHLAKWEADTVSGARYGLDVWHRHKPTPGAQDAVLALAERVTDPDIPAYLRDHAVLPNLSGLVDSTTASRVEQVDRRQGRSFTESYLFEGRRYNVTPDLLVIPADRFRPIRGSAFHGFEIAKEKVPFPFAIIRRAGGKRWAWDANKKRLASKGELEFRSLVRLTGKQQFFGGKLHFETADGDYVDDRHASRIEQAKRWPKWAKDGQKWLDINLTKQVLVAYEGMTMVYATLISSGEDGLADPDTSKRATIRGIYRVHTKWVTSTMDSRAVGEEFELRDVPYVQYFEEGYALHGAYWHDGFGTPKSHGCINLAPEDARRIFSWTEPAVPPGWHGAMKPLTGTIVFIHP